MCLPAANCTWLPLAGRNLLLSVKTLRQHALMQNDSVSLHCLSYAMMCDAEVATAVILMVVNDNIN